MATKVTKVETTKDGEVTPVFYEPATQELFTQFIGKQVTIDNGTDKPFIDVLEYVGKTDIITKHGSKYPFYQVKASE